VAVTVAPPGEVILIAPTGTSVERLDGIVRSKARWIASRVRLVQSAAPAPSPREFVSGESFLYLGRQYRLDVLSSPETPRVRLERGRLRVSVPATAGGKRAKAARAALMEWYRDHARARLLERVQWWAQRIGVPEPKVLVREQERRWGSCSASAVRFNWRIVQAPTRLVDYVVAHELVHLLHKHHGRAFWSALGQVLPDYERRRADLRQVGASLTW
jgi:hypothetical protein